MNNNKMLQGLLDHFAARHNELGRELRTSELAHRYSAGCNLIKAALESGEQNDRYQIAIWAFALPLPPNIWIRRLFDDLEKAIRKACELEGDQIIVLGMHDQPQISSAPKDRPFVELALPEVQAYYDAHDQPQTTC